uniref:Biogenesis of lysosome-related organelles complex 1 subunit 1 n=1 Tax=Astyanax mexicanus TaxID=7994 RepID=A0A8B9HGS8_ASTMX
APVVLVQSIELKAAACVWWQILYKFTVCVHQFDQKRRRREAIAAATSLTEALVDHLNVGVAQAYVNQRKLDHEVKTLQVQAGQFAKQTAQWITMVEGFNQALKEIGDVENWARSIEMDMRTIATALEYVHKGHLQAASS